MMTKVNPTGSTDMTDEDLETNNVIYIKKFFFDVIAYKNVRDFLLKLLMLSLIYHVGIGMLRHESRGLTKHVIQKFFIPVGKNKNVMKSSYLLGNHMIGKLDAILHNQRIPDEGSVPMHAYIDFVAKPCPRKNSRFRNAMKSALGRKFPQCFSPTAEFLNSTDHYVLQLLDNFTYQRNGKHCRRGPTFEKWSTTIWSRNWFEYNNKMDGFYNHYEPYSGKDHPYDSNKYGGSGDISNHLTNTSALRKLKFGNKYWTIRCANITHTTKHTIIFSIPYQINLSEASSRIKDLQAFHEYASAAMQLKHIHMTFYNAKFRSTFIIRITNKNFQNDWNFRKIESDIYYIDDTSIFEDIPFYSIIFAAAFAMFTFDAYCQCMKLLKTKMHLRKGKGKEKILPCHFLNVLSEHYIKGPNAIYHLLDAASTICYCVLLRYYYGYYGLLRQVGPNTCITLQDYTDKNIAESLSDNGDCFYTTSRESSWSCIACAGVLTLILTLRIVKTFRWHPGVSVMSETLYSAMKPLVDILFVASILFIGFGGGLQQLMGAVAGRKEFTTLARSINSVLRIAFGHFEYADFLNEGGDEPFEGLGLGGAASAITFIFWLLFFIFAVLVTNILIAIVSDAYEIHNDKAELTAYKVYIRSLLKQCVFICLLQWPCMPKRLLPKWALKMHTCRMYESRALAYLYVNPRDDQIWLSERQCNFLQLPPITEKNVGLSMTKMQFDKFLAKIIPRIKKKGKMYKCLDQHVSVVDNFKDSIWNLYKTNFTKRNKSQDIKGNFVRRALTQELNKREFETKIRDVGHEVQDVAKEVKEMKVTLGKILRLLEKQEHST